MEVSRVVIGKKKLVYVIIASRSLKYLWGSRSRVAYIGTTKKGMARIAQSASARANAVLGLHGVRNFIVRIVICAPRRKVKTWEKLERALLLAFRHKYGKLPVCNTVGKNIKETDEFRYFNRGRLEKILETLAQA